MPDKIILFGAGAAGRYALDHLAKINPDDQIVVAFAENNPLKRGTIINNVPVMDPGAARILFPDATWVACAIARSGATEIRSEIARMGVKSIPLWQVLPVQHGLPSDEVAIDIGRLVKHDIASFECFFDQLGFRAQPDYDKQMAPSMVEETYFPPFISHLDDEHFVDCGAADGDTIGAFLVHWQQWAHISAFEPDRENFSKLRSTDRIKAFNVAVSDVDGWPRFTEKGDYSSHLSGDTYSSHLEPSDSRQVRSIPLDVMAFDPPATYIKMDIEGSELPALWGARQIIAAHSPVLAICAYHKSSDLWQIPLLIHALNPDYKLFLRRYAEGAWELVWYAVPPERIIK